MQDRTFNRRDWLVSSGAALAAVSAVSHSAAAVADDQPANDSPPSKPGFKFCLNTSTIRGQKLTLAERIDIAAAAGYDGIEPWIREIDEHLQSGGKLSDLKKQIADHGLVVASAIGFANWLVDDAAARVKGLETAKRDMDLLSQIGGIRIAAPPAGATNVENLNLFAAAERYAKLLELGESMGVTPQLELWGFSKAISRLGELMFVATETGRRDACVLPDVYHIYKGGSDFSGLRMIDGAAMHAFHMNDYPSDPPRETIKDADRVYPGDGVAPLGQILRDLHSTGFHGMLSLELFNPGYWQQDATLVAKTGLAKMQAAVGNAFA